MKELDLSVILAVLQEMFGPLMWVVLVLAVLFLIAFLVLLVRERRLVGRRLAYSLLLGLLGGLLAEVIIVNASSSGYTDAGGPVDWVLIELIFLGGLAAATLVFYTVAGWWLASRGRSAAIPAH